MGTVWAQRREEVLRDCLVSPDVFHQMVERLAEFVVPYQHVLETEAGQRNVCLYLQGLLSHLPGKNAEDMATLVDVERQGIQAFVGTAPWDHRPLIEVLVAQVADRLGQPDGIIAFDPSSFPKRGTHSVGVKRQWCGHRGKVDNCQGGVFMGYVSRHEHALLDFRFSLPQEWARDEQRRQACHVPEEVRYQTRPEQGLEMLDQWGAQVPHGFATTYVSAVSAMCWECPAPPRCAIWRRHCPRTKDVDGDRKPRGNRSRIGVNPSTRRPGGG
jgi:SRSO17 transposase